MITQKTPLNLPFIFPLPGESPVQRIEGHHQTNLFPEPPGGTRQPHGDHEREGETPPSSAGSFSAQSGHGGQRDGGELQVTAGTEQNVLIL